MATHKKDQDSMTQTVMMKKWPRSLWRHFRAYCSLHGISAKEKMISLVRKELKENYKE